jgi:LuxR family transcriptional regulator, maltose regulon positive regulatory protein
MHKAVLKNRRKAPIQLLKPSLAVSKILPPRLPQILIRSRLIAWLEQNRHKKLILVCAQAAQGKSTLAASYVKQSEIPAAWLNLSVEESDPVNLFRLLVIALQHTFEYLDFSICLNYPGVSSVPREELPLYRDWTHSIYGVVDTPVRIVMDGLDRLSVDAPAFRLLQVLIEEAPEDIHFLLLSRSVPPLGIERLKVRREAVVLQNQQLAFSQDEARAFFQQMLGMSIPTEQLKRVHQLTEGWFGGLILLAEILRGLPEGARDGYLARELPGRFKAEVFQYFGEEILAAQSPENRDFLIKTSILEVIEPDFARELLAAENVEEILQDLANKNLFVQSIYDEKRGWLFRFHQLFRDFLQTRFLVEFKEEQRRSCLLAAATLYEHRGELESSVKYSLEAQAYAQSVSVIERIGLDLLKTGRRGDLTQWLQQLPTDLIEGSPWLLLYLSMTMRFMQGEENIARLRKALALFKQMEDLRGRLLSLAALIDAMFMTGCHACELDRLIDESVAWTQSLSSDRHPYEQAILYARSGFACLRNDPRKAFLALHRAYLSFKDCGDFFLQANSLSRAMEAVSWLGEFTLARELLDKLEPLMAQCPYPDIKAELLLNCSGMLFFSGDLNGSKQAIRMVLEETEKHGLKYLYPVALLYRLMAMPHCGEFTEAEQVGKQLVDLASAMGIQHIQGATLLVLGNNSYRQGDLTKAREYIERTTQVFSSNEARSLWHLNAARIMMGLIEMHAGHFVSAEQYLMAAMKYYSANMNHLFMTETHMVLAILKYEQGQSEEAARQISLGFQIAKEKGYHHFIALSLEDVTRACILAVELEVDEAMDYAAHLLTTKLADLATPELDRLMRSRKSTTRATATRVRTAIHRSTRPRLRIETLGSFHLLRGDSPVEKPGASGSQPRMLLKAIIARGNSAVPKEMLIDDLWPESPPAAGENTFKVNLNRLRRLLEPDMDASIGSSYVHLQDGLVYLDQELCQVDVAEFLSLCQEGEDQEHQGHIKATLVWYQEACRRYRGDFLAEEPYAPWAQDKRHALRDKYLLLLHKMAEFHEKRGSSKKAIDCYHELIAADPLAEQAYQRLMLLYAHRGMRNAALRTYEKCTAALQSELQTTPDAVTTAIHRKILAAI